MSASSDFLDVQDVQIESEVAALIAERARLSAEATWVTEHKKKAIINRLIDIDALIGTPDETALFTSDDASAWVNEENLAAANARLRNARERATRSFNDMVKASFVHAYRRANERDEEAALFWLDMARAIENHLMDNPASHWLPY